MCERGLWLEVYYTYNKTFAQLPVNRGQRVSIQLFLLMCWVEICIFVMDIITFHYYIKGTLIIATIINYQNRGQSLKPLFHLVNLFVHSLYSEGIEWGPCVPLTVSPTLLAYMQICKEWNCGTLKDLIYVSPVLSSMAGLSFWFYLVLCWHQLTVAHWYCMACEASLHGWLWLDIAVLENYLI